jgi:hypothetical protein
MVSIFLSLRHCCVVNYPVVTEHLLSVILEGYISTLTAIEARSKMRGARGDVRPQP